MSQSNNNVLVFGAAGAVGRAAAITASSRGAKVYLGMRDIKKPIEGLSSAEEAAAGLTRVHADLTNTVSLKAAVKQSGAKSAFVYTLHVSHDHMRSAFETLKESGVTYIVLLSSWSVQPSAQAAKNYGFIPKVHAETEIQLSESGIRYAALRPAYFNSNMFWYIEEFKKGEVEVFRPDALHDFIAPEDIGAVAGALLATTAFRDQGNEKNGKIIYLCGPKVMSQADGISVVADVLGKEVKIVPLTEEQFLQKNKFFPKPVAESIVDSVKAHSPPNEGYPKELYEEAVDNLRKFKEREPMSLIEWVEAHKSAFV